MVVEEKEFNLTADRAKYLLREILKERFPRDPSRQEIIPRADRLNISCPYCGDSHKGGHVKRGNLYLTSGMYKCYNAGCETYVGFPKMLDEWNLGDELDPMERAGLVTLNREVRERIANLYHGEISVDHLLQVDWNEILPTRNFIMDILGLEDVDHSPLKRYLEKRQQVPDQRFAGDPRNNQLYIFNMHSDGKHVFALQIKTFKEGSKKYLTYSLSAMWEKLLKRTDEEFLEKCKEWDYMSWMFGLSNLKFDQTITLFEGPLDSFLFPNSIGLCSLNNRFPFPVENKRYFLDNDKSGRKDAMEKLKEGESVFLWEKFFKENDIPRHKVKDLNDLVVYLRAHKKKIKRLENYFSQDKFDLMYL
jgi:hypothetical protein